MGPAHQQQECRNLDFTTIVACRWACTRRCPTISCWFGAYLAGSSCNPQVSLTLHSGCRCWEPPPPNLPHSEVEEPDKNKTPLRGPLFLWRCGESNPGPLKFQRRHLRAQPTASLSGLGLCRLVSFGLIRSWSFPAGPGSRRGHSCIATPLTGEAGTHRGDELRI